MILRRRGLLGGLLGGLLAMPAIIRTPGLLMPVKPVAEGYRVSDYLTDRHSWSTDDGDFLVLDKATMAPLVEMSEDELRARRVDSVEDAVARHERWRRLLDRWEELDAV